MKKYFDHMQTKTPHERRQHALKIASGVVALAFIVWISTLGLRFASTPPQVATDDTSSQTASVVQAQNGNATLIVATTSDTTYFGN